MLCQNVTEYGGDWLVIRASGKLVPVAEPAYANTGVKPGITEPRMCRARVTERECPARRSLAALRRRPDPAGSRAPLARTRAAGAAGDEPLHREHRPRERLHGLQPRPAGLRRDHARLRQVAGRRLPRDPDRERGDRHRPGGAGQERARPARSARHADARVVRDGEPRELAVEQVVRRRPRAASRAGDQVVADGRLARRPRCALDESILTGEAEPVARAAGDEVRSGSFAVEGDGALRRHRGRPGELRRARRRRGARSSATHARRSSSR